MTTSQEREEVIVGEEDISQKVKKLLLNDFIYMYVFKKGYSSSIPSLVPITTWNRELHVAENDRFSSQFDRNSSLLYE